MKKSKKQIWVWVLGVLILGATSSKADQRQFGYSYVSDSILPKNKFEFEQWITYKNNEKEKKTVYESKQEIEYGLTDKLTTALYFNSEIVDTKEENSTKFKGISSEWKYMYKSPNENPLGIMFYGEITAEEEAVEFEEKLILNHKEGNYNVALNLIYEQEIETEEGETEFETAFKTSVGVAYKVTPRLSIAAEGKADFSNNAIHLGPTVQYEFDKGFALLTVLKEVTNKQEVNDTEMRLVLGILF